jgi:hypothetical protein
MPPIQTSGKLKAVNQTAGKSFLSSREFATLLVIAALLAAAGGFFLWRKYRWDEPWLQPHPQYSQLAIRFQGLDYRDKDYEKLKSAFLSIFPAGKGAYGFLPDDVFCDSTAWPRQYAWVKVLGYMEKGDLNDNIKRCRDAVAKAVAKTGLSVKWHFVYIAKDGTVYHPD